MGILVIGSFMMDLVVRTKRFPESGETVFGSSFSKFLGGKGANQAVAAVRLGADVTMVGKVGSDPFGDDFLYTLKNEGIKTANILRDTRYPTGVGSITLEENGNNRIVVVPGANLHYNSSELDNIKSLFHNAELLMVQLEMDLNMIEKAVAYAAEVQVPVILNPAPAQRLSDDLLKNVSYLTPNESEVEILTGIKVLTLEDAENAGKVLLNKGVQNVIITLAEKGSLIVNRKETVHVPSLKVKPVDTVAAGDSFNGALAVGIVNGRPLKDAVEYANAVGAITVTREGAIPSLPTKLEVEEFLIHYVDEPVEHTN
jgi:ribokinase